MKLDKNKLAAMTKEQKLKLLDLVQEKKRRDKLRPNNYVPNAGQLPVHQSKCLNRFSFSANGSGKTALLANEAIWAAEGYNPIHKEFTPVPCRILVLLDQPAKVAESWLPELRKWTVIPEENLHKDGKPYYNRISFPNGSSITFAFHDQDFLRLEGIELDMVIMDEPCGREAFVSLQRAGRRKGRKAKYLFGGTPITAPWLRTMVHQPWSRGELPDTECFKASTEVNKNNLAEGYIERFSRFLTEKEKQVRLHGEWFDLSGNALLHLFDEQVHNAPLSILEEFKEKQWPCAVAIDPHISKPVHAILLGVAPDGQRYVLKELSRKMLARQFARELKTWSEGFRIIDWVCDSLGSADLSGGEGFMSFIDVLKSEGIRVRATTYDEKSDEDFISKIQEVLFIPGEGKPPKLKIVSNCIGLKTDIREVQWVKTKGLELYKPKLDISNKDYLSCLKYALAVNLRFNSSHDRIIRSSGPVSWAERSGDKRNRRFNKPTAKRYYTDGRAGSDNGDDF